MPVLVSYVLWRSSGRARGGQERSLLRKGGVRYDSLVKKHNPQAIFCGHVLDEVLKGVRGITAQAMFGGYGIYREGRIFGIIANNKLFFKVDETNQLDYEEKGSKPFVYAQGNHKLTTMSYWEVPQEIMKDRAVLKVWVDRACEVSKRSSVKKRRMR